MASPFDLYQPYLWPPIWRSVNWRSLMKLEKLAIEPLSRNFPTFSWLSFTVLKSQANNQHPCFWTNKSLNLSQSKRLSYLMHGAYTLSNNTAFDPFQLNLQLAINPLPPELQWSRIPNTQQIARFTCWAFQSKLEIIRVPDSSTGTLIY